MRGTHCLLQLAVFLLGVYEIQDDVERTRQDEREEKTEPCEIHIPLGAAPTRHQRRHTASEKDVLEFASRHTGLGSRVLDLACSEHVKFCVDTRHPLEGIEEEDANESAT